MTKHTPYTLFVQTSHATQFKHVPVGTMFSSNGNLWQKVSTRTALGHWPSYLPSHSMYFGQSEIVAVQKD